MKLFYRKSGSGPALVILHGLYGSSDNWVSIARLISEKYTVILPDLRNHGSSPHHADNSYEAMAHDLDELTVELQLNKFLLAGHSMGGKVAMKYAMNHPEKINSLLILDISPFGSRDASDQNFTGHEKILESLISTSLKGVKSREEVEKSLTRYIESERTRSFLMKNLQRTEKGGYRWKINAAALLANLPEIMDGIVKKDDTVAQVTGFPVLFARGADSDYLKENEYLSISRIFPAADFITVENAGHWIHADRPDAVSQLLLNLI